MAVVTCFWLRPPGYCQWGGTSARSRASLASPVVPVRPRGPLRPHASVRASTLRRRSSSACWAGSSPRAIRARSAAPPRDAAHAHRQYHQYHWHRLRAPGPVPGHRPHQAGLPPPRQPPHPSSQGRTRSRRTGQQRALPPQEQPPRSSGRAHLAPPQGQDSVLSRVHRPPTPGPPPQGKGGRTPGHHLPRPPLPRAQRPRRTTPFRMLSTAEPRRCSPRVTRSSSTSSKSSRWTPSERIQAMSSSSASSE